MSFDDFNYKAFNQHILVQEPKEMSKTLEELENRLSSLNPKAMSV